MKIITALKGETVIYAAEELKKYITEMSRGKIVPLLTFCDTLPEKIEKDTITLALLDDLNLDTSDLDDAFIDDILDVDIKNLTGYIAGSNERSILMAVYKFCYSAGCRFIRPGEGGDYVPEADIENHSFKYRKKADYPFRGECTEGAVSYEHIRDTVYWLPKVGMNMYMIEGLVPYAYMNRWYAHQGNRKLRKEPAETDYNMLEKYVDLMERDMKRAGVQLHTLGHGWMFENLGLHTGDPKGEEIAKTSLTEEQKKHLALVKGEREIQHGHTFYTHFCYSNPETRKLLVSYMVEYIKKKPYIDFVHMWLADATNNQCECGECVKMHPSDWYVMMLNELDEELTRLGLDTRIVFIMYVDTVRPPEKLRLKNPKRFVLLSAIGLHYETGYINEEYKGEIPPYKRNQYHPEPNSLRLKWHRDWKEMHNNLPSMIFEYRFYTDMYCDLGHMQISRETYRDMKGLENVSFNGCMNDQTHRMYMPTSLPLITMGETLFDKNIDFEKMATEYFDGAFGEDGAKVREYLEKMTQYLCPSNFRVGGGNGVEEAGLGDIEVQKKCWLNNPYVAEQSAKIPALIDEFLPTIEKNISNSVELARVMSWNYLKYHAEICRLFSKVLNTGATEGKEAAQAACHPLIDYLSEHEMEFHNAFDLFLFVRTLVLKLDLSFDDVR